VLLKAPLYRVFHETCVKLQDVIIWVNLRKYAASSYVRLSTVTPLQSFQCFKILYTISYQPVSRLLPLWQTPLPVTPTTPISFSLVTIKKNYPARCWLQLMELYHVINWWRMGKLCKIFVDKKCNKYDTCSSVNSVKLLCGKFFQLYPCTYIETPVAAWRLIIGQMMR
jgi:hypothetical protein